MQVFISVPDGKQEKSNIAQKPGICRKQSFCYSELRQVMEPGMSTLASHYDVLIIGGGINGVGIAYDAASRGAKVLLVEQHDFASGTSSASSKLIHGGLRYLEHYEFRLVREALKEREVLMRIAPHLVTPLRF